MDSWFKEGLKEIGITPEQYKGMTKKEQQEIKKYLEELGHG